MRLGSFRNTVVALVALFVVCGIVVMYTWADIASPPKRSGAAATGGGAPFLHDMRFNDEIGTAITSVPPLPPATTTLVLMYISDKYTSPNSRIQSLQDVSNPAFRAFISKVLDGIEGKLGRYAISPDDTGELHFVRIAVASSGDHIPTEETSAVMPADNACIIHSPWAEIAILSEPTLRIYGTFFWNERQILQDQAILANLTSVPSAHRRAMPWSFFEQLAQEYADNEILRTPAERSATLSAEHIPPDVLWLFRHSPQSTRGPFSSIADGTMRQIAERAASFYADLAVALVDRCLDEPRDWYDYDSIFDLRGIISLERDDLN